MGLWTLESKVHLWRSFLERKRGHEHLNSFSSLNLPRGAAVEKNRHVDCRGSSRKRVEPPGAAYQCQHKYD